MINPQKVHNIRANFLFTTRLHIYNSSKYFCRILRNELQFLYFKLISKKYNQNTVHTKVTIQLLSSSIKKWNQESHCGFTLTHRLDDRTSV